MNIKKNAEEFASLFKKQKDEDFQFVFSGQYADMNSLLKKLKLNHNQNEVLKEIINLLLTDTYYGILLGFDGAANIGGVQQTYKVYNEQGNLISNCGELEAAAWEYFHSDNEK
ncbi:MAG: hypothetical protein FWC11_05230 [Firmicutes bacterium]|nr:hypothetical protein [Bacillota bacterium]MCL2255857.1 hypothetical protein [Bacillota bacterium]MCL2256245.1 hypothetical protein [Bacillota bacterium]